MSQIVIKQGKAKVINGGLRCANFRKDKPTLLCDKQLVRKNTNGQIAGSFKCDRCGAIVEVGIKIPISVTKL
jgi:hypothetical protein